MEDNTKIAVIGAGALGGITAAFIARAGYDVEVVCKHEELARKIREGGIHVFGARGDSRVSMRAVAKIPELCEPKDIVILATKANDALEAARELLPHLSDKSTVVLVQNGICEDTVGEVLGEERIVSCVTDVGATMHGPGELELTAKGRFVIGNINGRDDARLPPISRILSAAFPTSISNNIRGIKYYKLVINSCINSMGVISGLRLGEMIFIKKIREIFTRITDEALLVSDAMGIRVENFPGTFDLYNFVYAEGIFYTLIRYPLAHILNIKYRRLKPSSLQSLERGKPTEVDYLNGYIAANGRRHNIPTPVNDRMIEIVKDIESGRRNIGPENLDRINR